MRRNWILHVAVLAAFALTVHPVWADQWEFLGKHPQGNMYLNRESVHRVGDTINFWVKRVYYKPQESTISKMKFKEQWVYQELNCGKNTMNLKQMIFKDSKGKVVGGYFNLKEGPKPIKSPGFFAQESKLLCKPAGKPSTAPEKKPASGAAKPTEPKR